MEEELNLRCLSIRQKMAGTFFTKELICSAIPIFRKIVKITKNNKNICKERRYLIGEVNPT